MRFEFLPNIKNSALLPFKCMLIALRYEKEVFKEAWSNSLTRHTWWKAVSAGLVIMAVNGIIVSDLDAVIGESGARHGIRAATLALGVAVMAFVSMMPKSNRRLDLFIRILSGLMGIAAAAFWLLGETDGHLLPILIVVMPTVAAVVVGGVIIMFTQSMWNWETAVKERDIKNDAKSDKSETQEASEAQESSRE